MSLLFDRYVAITVGTLRVSQLRCVFSVSKNSKPEPNKAHIKIYNMSREHLALFSSQARNVPVQIDAGYAEAYNTIFLGELRFGEHTRENGVDTITTIETADKAAIQQTARVNATIPKGAQSGDILRTVARALGVGDSRGGAAALDKGNLDDAVALMRSNSIFSSGTCLTGSAWREMTNVCRSLGLVWSVQEGKLQILKVGGAITGRAILLTPDTGLLGSPSVDQKGILSADMLMRADVAPGRIVRVKSAFIDAAFVIDESTHSGDFSVTDATGDWKVSIKAKPY